MWFSLWVLICSMVVGNTTMYYYVLFVYCLWLFINTNGAYLYGKKEKKKECIFSCILIKTNLELMPFLSLTNSSPLFLFVNGITILVILNTMN